MKKDNHPIYHSDAKITCVCGSTAVAGSTQKDIKVDICSKCHPFYTGKQKLIDTAGRVEKFEAKIRAAKKHAQDSKEKNESSKSKKKDGKYMTIEDMKALKKKSSGADKSKSTKKTAAKSKKTTKKK